MTGLIGNTSLPTYNVLILGNEQTSNQSRDVTHCLHCVNTPNSMTFSNDAILNANNVLKV